MATTVIRLNHNSGADDFGTVNRLNRMLSDPTRAREACLELGRILECYAAGQETGNVEVQLACTTAVRANGWIQFASASGAVGATIDGTLKTVTWATSDSASIAALVAAINADATINKKVYAALIPGTNRAGIYALSPGVNGNKITLALSGTGVTVSGANLTGGAGDDVIPVTFTRT